MQQTVHVAQVRAGIGLAGTGQLGARQALEAWQHPFARAWFEGKRVRLLGPTRIGAHGTPIFFLHPKDMGGVLTEIMESPKQAQ